MYFVVVVLFSFLHIPFTRFRTPLRVYAQSKLGGDGVTNEADEMDFASCSAFSETRDFYSSFLRFFSEFPGAVQSRTSLALDID